MSDFQNLKLIIIEFFNLSKDALHLHIGLLVFIAVVMLVSRSGVEVWALAAAAFVAMGLEAIDLSDDFGSLGEPRWLASAHDVANTLFWPIILTILARFRLVQFGHPTQIRRDRLIDGRDSAADYAARIRAFRKRE